MLVPRRAFIKTKFLAPDPTKLSF